ncbi:MFS transporter [Streptomyces sp. NPDC051104]|uniref:MFS transporter n=1 Tax=Streptomyces sp. NPDC051104 TaxID=3155044 RepID=UPI00343319C8
MEQYFALLTTGRRKLTKDLHLSASLVGWMAGACAAPEIPLVITVGRLVDRVGKIRVVAAAVVLAVVFFCLPMAGSAPVLIALQMPNAMWIAVITSIPMVVVQQEVPAERARCPHSLVHFPGSPDAGRSHHRGGHRAGWSPQRLLDPCRSVRTRRRVPPHVHDRPPTDIIAACEAGGYDYVKGAVLDRVAAGGSPAALKRHESIWTQYPLAGLGTLCLPGADRPR